MLPYSHIVISRPPQPLNILRHVFAFDALLSLPSLSLASDTDGICAFERDCVCVCVRAFFVCVLAWICLFLSVGLTED